MTALLFANLHVSVARYHASLVQLLALWVQARGARPHTCNGLAGGDMTDGAEPRCSGRSRVKSVHS